MSCEDKRKNLGLSKCNKLPSMPRSIITTGSNFKFTPEQCADSAAFKTALEAALLAGKANRIYLWPFFKGIEPMSEEAIREATALGTMKVRDGRYAWKFMVSENLCLHKAMFTHRANSGRAFIYDDKGQLIGTEDASGNFYGFTIDLLDTEKFVFSDGAVATKSPVFLSLMDNLELDQDGAILDRDISKVISTTFRLTDVVLEVSDVTADDFTVKVTQKCDGTEVIGLVAADFSIKKASDGTAQAKTLVDNGDGTYTLSSATAFVDGTVELVSPATLSIKGYESISGAVTVNVP